jgi:hypothetical protein
VSGPTPDEILRRARPIPTYRDHPATSPTDIEGVTPAGEVVTVGLTGSVIPTLLLFLSATCMGCLDLWEGTAELGRALPEGVRIVIVTKGPDQVEAGAIAVLAPADTPVVMSSDAFRHYRVGGPPFLVLIAGGEVRTEGVAWGIGETARATREALGTAS